MPFELKDTHGNPIKTDGIDPKIIAMMQQVGAAISRSTVDTVSNAVNSQMDEIKSGYTTLTEQVAELVKTKPASSEKQSTKDDQHQEKNENPKLAGIVDAITKLNDKLDGVISQTKAKDDATSAMERTSKLIREKYPNFVGADTLIKTVAAMDPKDDAAVEQGIAAERARMEAYSGKEAVDKAFGASIEGEGGKSAEDNTEAAEIKSKNDRLSAKLDKFDQ